MQKIQGKIHSVKLKNFVVYDSVEFFPGEYLNIIIGPNGTGKSTLVSAIVLGMGGNAKSLARMSNVKDYIKNGKDHASIHIEIYGKEKTKRMLFSRYFDLDGDDKFEMEKKPCSKVAFLKGVAQFNIQVDNLCQFLPQDRVQDFTKMNAQELLHNTQSSVCAPETVDFLEQLKVKRIEQKNQGKSLQEAVVKLKEHEQRNETLKAEIEVIGERTNLVKQLAICEKKKAWIEFEELYVKLQEQKNDQKSAEKNLKKREQEMEPYQQQFQKIESTKTKYEKDIKETRDQCDKQMNDVKKCDDELYKLHDAINKAKSDFVFAETSQVEQRNQLQDALIVHEVCIQDLKNANEMAGSETERKSKLAIIDKKIAEIKLENQNLLEKRRNISQHLELSIKPQMLNLSAKIKAIESVADRKLELLRQRFDHAYRGVMWLRNNGHLFQGKIYEPMILEITVKDSKYAKYLESSISERDLLAFTCERKEDMRLLHRKLRTEQDLQVNMIHSEAATSVTYKAKRNISQLHPYGFFSYLIDLIDAPIPILNALCRLCRIHNIPVGNDQTFDMTDDMPTDLVVFYSTNHQFTIGTSRYSTTRTLMCKEIQTRNLLNIGVNMTTLQEQKKQHAELLRESDRVKNQHTKIEDRIGAKEAINSELTAERRKIDQKFDLLNTCKSKCARQMQKIALLKQQTIDIKLEKQKQDQVIERVVREMFGIQEKKVAAYESYGQKLHKNEQLREQFCIFGTVNAEIVNQLTDHREQVETAKKFVAKISDVVARTEKQCKAKKIAALQMTDGQTPGDQGKFRYTKAFGKLPSLIAELQTHMNELQAQVDCLRVGSETVLEEYNNRNTQIVELREAIANYDETKKRIEEEMEALHVQWHPKVLETVAVINNNFGTFMGSMGFAGEVELTHNDLRDYAEYGIQIRVKYRNNEKLQTLDRFVQSGGERAVAIAVYTLSLQQITNVPFRCVDEINQGMDPTNERKVFDVLVDQAAQPGKSQYFFVSPKLLHNFSYNTYMKFHCVHNGVYTDAQKQFSNSALHCQ